MKPKPLTPSEIESGNLPSWREKYAAWLSTLPCYQNMTNRAHNGRVRALRALFGTLQAILPVAFPESEIIRMQTDINDLAKLKARS